MSDEDCLAIKDVIRQVPDVHVVKVQVVMHDDSGLEQLKVIVDNNKKKVQEACYASIPALKNVPFIVVEEDKTPSTENEAFECDTERLKRLQVSLLSPHCYFTYIILFGRSSKRHSKCSSSVHFTNWRQNLKPPMIIQKMCKVA